MFVFLTDPKIHLRLRICIKKTDLEGSRFDFKETAEENVFLPNCYDTETEGKKN